MNPLFFRQASGQVIGLADVEHRRVGPGVFGPHVYAGLPSRGVPSPPNNSMTNFNRTPPLTERHGLKLVIDRQKLPPGPPRIRTRIITVAARLAHRAHTISLHLPEHWPWAAAFDNLFTAVQTTPG